MGDSGCGMDVKVAERIFDPFFTTKSHGQGTGLGLSTVYGILQLHQAKIECETEPGKGTLFTIYFKPAQVEEQVTQQEISNQSEEGEGGEGKWSSLRILLVDDEEIILEVTKEALEEKGFEVLVADSGDSALELVKNSGELDLIILDLGLPGMSGEQVLKEILAICPKAKILVANGYVGHPMAREPHRYGAVGFLAKPFDLATLEELIKVHSTDQPSL